MNLSIKAIVAAATLSISYLNNIFSPLIWGLGILIIIDILFNVHKEGQQLQKIGSAFATLGGTALIQSGHVFSSEAIHGLVAVMFLAYVQVVIPQLVTGISKLKFLAPGTKAGAVAALEAEILALKAQAEKEKITAIHATENPNAENKIVINAADNK